MHCLSLQLHIRSQPIWSKPQSRAGGRCIDSARSNSWCGWAAPWPQQLGARPLSSTPPLSPQVLCFSKISFSSSSLTDCRMTHCILLFTVVEFRWVGPAVFVPLVESANEVTADWWAGTPL
jgi:hypothetical protein